jgi:hypothetical protein
MRKVIYILFLLLNLFAVAQAQQKTVYDDTALLQQDEKLLQPPAEDVSPDTATYQILQQTAATEEEPADTSLYMNDLDFSYDSIKNWRNSKDYAYIKILDSLLKNLKKKKEHKAQSQPSTPDTGIFTGILGSGFLELLLWTLAICFVLFVIYRLFLAEGVFKRTAKSKTAEEAEVEEEEITHESNFDALIRQALQNGNYRLALRYQYLRTLHLLAGKGMVSLAPDKTNFNYVTEITTPEYRNAFAALTLHYEYAWYGEFDVDKNIYEKIEHNFSSLNKKI